MGQLVSGYLDFAERQAEKEIAMTMKDWAEHLDGILTSTGEQLLTGNGTISHQQAMEKAEIEYKKLETIPDSFRCIYRSYFLLRLPALWFISNIRIKKPEEQNSILSLLHNMR